MNKFTRIKINIQSDIELVYIYKLPVLLEYTYDSTIVGVDFASNFCLLNWFDGETHKASLLSIVFSKALLLSNDELYWSWTSSSYSK